jgi:hypothetical protein
VGCGVPWRAHDPHPAGSGLQQRRHHRTEVARSWSVTTTSTPAPIVAPAGVHNTTEEQWFRQHLDEDAAQPIAETLARIHEAHLAAER